MSHRSRSRTVDSVDSKKPRRLTEKIAIMKKREHEQLEEFEHAMQSIHEMQRARIHSGGGSMPSLQSIDSMPSHQSTCMDSTTTPNLSIDMQRVLQDYNEVTQGGLKSTNSKDRPHSSGPSGRRGTVIKTSSMDTDPYPTAGLNHSEHYWNVSHSGEWVEGDLSRHKSDSDLQQSLLMQQSQSSTPQHMSPLPHNSPQQQQPRNLKLNPPPDLALWRRTNSASTAHALLSPDQYAGTQELPVPSPLGVSGAGGTASSLPDLTNIEFSSGLDVPLEKDDSNSIPVTAPLGGQQPDQHQQQQQQQQQQQLFLHQQQQKQLSQSLNSRGRSFFSPPGTSGPGPSKLLYTSFQHNPSATAFTNNIHPNPNQFAPPRYPIPATGFQFTVLPPGAGTGTGTGTKPGGGGGGMGMRSTASPLTAFQAVPQPLVGPGPGGGGGGGGITKSPTMPDFRSLQSVAPPHSNAMASHEYPFTRLKPILPDNLQGTNVQSYNSSMGALLDPFIPQIMDPLNQRGSQSGSGGGGGGGGGILPPMTIIIQPPNPMQQQAVTTTAVVTESKQAAAQQVQRPLASVQRTHLQQQQQQQQQHTQPPITSSIVDTGAHHHQAGSPYVNTPTSDPAPKPAPQPSHSSFPAGNSLPNTPTITISPGLGMPGAAAAAVLPSYMEAKQQQALQQKFASINVNKTEALIRSHSEENLQKVQREKVELIQQNPFMGTLTNANSVPCVYVEPQNMDQQQDGRDSPTNLDSPSTSASYASSPPSVRPFWLDHPNSLNEFVFHEWPLDSTLSIGGGGPGGPGGAGGGMRPGSPPHHHRSLTDLIQSTIPDLNELDPGYRGKAALTHQLSLPSVAMTDLTVDEHGDRHAAGSPSDFLVPSGGADFDMEESVMDLIKNVSDMQSFDMSHVLQSEAGLLSHAESLLSPPPDSYH